MNISPPFKPEQEEEVADVMIEEPSSPQQSPQNKIIQRVLGGLESKGTNIVAVLVEVVEEVMIVGTAAEVLLERGLEVKFKLSREGLRKMSRWRDKKTKLEKHKFSSYLLTL